MADPVPFTPYLEAIAIVCPLVLLLSLFFALPTTWAASVKAIIAFVPALMVAVAIVVRWWWEVRCG